MAAASLPSSTMGPLEPSPAKRDSIDKARLELSPGWPLWTVSQAGTYWHALRLSSGMAPHGTHWHDN